MGSTRRGGVEVHPHLQPVASASGAHQGADGLDRSAPVPNHAAHVVGVHVNGEIHPLAGGSLVHHHRVRVTHQGLEDHLGDVLHPA